MSSEVQCPICGRMVESEELEILDNGNPACSDCAAKEKQKNEE